jgi:hypothetical protein
MRTKRSFPSGPRDRLLWQFEIGPGKKNLLAHIK